MFDIGFWEILIIAVVVLIVLGPERLPEVAKQGAFFVRKARQGMFRLRREMQSEIEGTPFEDLREAKREMSNFTNDIKQFGRDLADSHEKEKADETPQDVRGEEVEKSNQMAADAKTGSVKKASSKKASKKTAKKTTKKTAKKASKKVSKKVAKKASKKTAKKKTSKKKAVKKATS